MTVLSVIVGLWGAVMLLLFGVRMAQTGVERLFGADMKRTLTERPRPRALNAGMGLGLAMALQSSAAAMMLICSFAAAGMIGFPAGLAMALGADLGSALVIMLLSARPEWLTPMVVGVGAWLFLHFDGRPQKQVGRLVLGVGLVLSALALIGHAMAPLREGPVLPAAAAYLEADFVTAFLLGAGLATLMHSSVATVLVCVGLAHTGAAPALALVSVALGANLGGAFIPAWLTRAMPPAARRIPVANLGLRGAGAILALLIVNLSPLSDALRGQPPILALLGAHIGFNAALLLAGLPLVAWLEAPLRHAIPDVAEPVAGPQPVAIAAPQSALDPQALGGPRAYACVEREALRLSQIVEGMISPIMDLYKADDPARMAALAGLGRSLETGLSDMRRYVAAIPADPQAKAEQRRMREVLDYAIGLRRAGDIATGRIAPLIAEKHAAGIKFSKPGRQELSEIHDRIMAAAPMAFHVLAGRDLEAARNLIEEKAEVERMIRRSRKRHLKRLREGESASFDSSDLHLETLAAFSDIAGLVAAIAYPLLERGGLLLETRLVSPAAQTAAHGQ